MASGRGGTHILAINLDSEGDDLMNEYPLVVAPQQTQPPTPTKSRQVDIKAQVAQRARSGDPLLFSRASSLQPFQSRNVPPSLPSGQQGKPLAEEPSLEIIDDRRVAPATSSGHGFFKKALEPEASLVILETARGFDRKPKVRFIL